MIWGGEMSERNFTSNWVFSSEKLPCSSCKKHIRESNTQHCFAKWTLETTIWHICCNIINKQEAIFLWAIKATNISEKKVFFNNTSKRGSSLFSKVKLKRNSTVAYSEKQVSRFTLSRHRKQLLKQTWQFMLGLEADM